ncbi:MAG: AI-2E family transporter [Clostridiales Family XIII bacterium]|jgi:predicted PurR-regulated permease PerM|nr:AI-2E family transporter [Clostridiales Family XIII bacterium]
MNDKNKKFHKVFDTPEDEPVREEARRDVAVTLRMPDDMKGRIITIAILVLVLITIWFMLDLVIVTFILTFVFFHLVKYAQRGLARTPLPHVPDGLILTVLYVAVIGLAVLFCIYYLPILFGQVASIAESIGSFDFEKFLKELDPGMKSIANLFDFNKYFSSLGDLIMNGMKSAGTSLLNLMLAILLSFLMLLEKSKIRRIGKTIESSRISFIYRYFVLFGGSFCYTFGKVMKVQVLIAAINCGVSMLYLTITGFPNILALGIMIFVLGLIPVAGAFISLVPLCIIAFNVGGVFKIVEVLIMIAIIHCLEAYFLNPKLMSQKTNLPVSIVFIVLIVAQKYLGMWGMLIGVPVFIYVLAVLDIRYREAVVGKKGED